MLPSSLRSRVGPLLGVALVVPRLLGASPPVACRVPSIESTPAAEARRRAIEGDVAWAVQQLPGLPVHSLSERMRRYGVPGLSIAVVHRHRLDWVGSYGWADVARRVPVTDTTRFLPGSISKALNAVALLDRVQRGRLSLSADVNRSLHRWRVRPTMMSKGRPVTLAGLLSHTAGTSVRGFWGYRPGEPLPSLLDILDGRPPATSAPVRVVHPPGERVAYSGGGTLVTQLLLEELDGRAYAPTVTETVLAPLGMGCSGFAQPVPASVAPAMATGYRAGGTAVAGGRAVMPEQAAAGLWTTASDLGRFLVALHAALDGRAKGPLTPRIARWMTTPVRAGAPGMGLFVRDTAGVRIVEHGAGNQGFSGIIVAVVGTGDGVAIVQNGESAGLLDELVRTVARHYRWPVLGAPTRARTVTPATPAPLPPVDLPGLYREGERLIRITRHGDTLRYQAGEIAWDIRMTGPDRFVTVETETEKRIVRDTEGRIVAIARLLGGREVGRAVRERPFVPTEAWLEALTGRYRDPRGGLFTIERRGTALTLVQDGVRLALIPASATRLLAPADFLVGREIVRDRRGRVLALLVDAGAGPERAERVGR